MRVGSKHPTLPIMYLDEKLCNLQSRALAPRSRTDGTPYYRIDGVNVEAARLVRECCLGRKDTEGGSYRFKDGNKLNWKFDNILRVEEPAPNGRGSASVKVVARHAITRIDRIYNSVREAADAVNGSSPSISRAIKNRTEYKGYHWLKY